MLKDIDTNRKYLTTPQAAERSGLSKVYLAQLLRKGTLDKSGPKGPIKKSAQKQQDETLTNENNV